MLTKYLSSSEWDKSLVNGVRESCVNAGTIFGKMSMYKSDFQVFNLCRINIINQSLGGLTTTIVLGITIVSLQYRVDREIRVRVMGSIYSFCE